MSLLVEQYIRKPFTVNAVQVTLDNMEEVAKWCGGEIIIEKRGGRLIQYIKVDVNRPLNDRQTKAFVEDWVLEAGTGYKCYSKKSFPSSFEKYNKAEVTPDELAQAFDLNMRAAMNQGQEPLFEAPQ